MTSPVNLNLQASSFDKYKIYYPYLAPTVGVLLLLAAVVLTLVPGMSLGVPSLSQLGSYKDQIDTNSAQATSLESKIKSLQGLDQANLTANLNKVNQSIPSDKDVSGTLAVINQLAVSSSTTLVVSQLLTSAVGNKPADQNTMEFQVVLHGSFPNLKDFLVKLEHAKLVMAVRSININISEGSNLTADLVVDSYYEPLVAASSLSSSPLPSLSAAQTKLLTDLDSRTNYPAPVPTSTTTGRSDPFSGF